MFRRPAVRYGNTPQPDTRYQRGVQEWDERIGSARVQAENWRLAFFAAMLMSCTLAAGLVWQSARGTITPWVVEVDKLGQTQAVAPAVSGYRPTDPQIAWHLATFVKWVRGVSTDGAIMHDNWLNAYDYVTDKGKLALNDYVHTADPISKRLHEQVTVDISSVIRASDDSFRIEWIERHFVDGALSSTQHWSAIFTVVIHTPTDPDRLKANPLGLYIDAFNWSKELG